MVTRLTERKVCYPRCDNQGNLDKVDYIAIKDKKMAEEKLCQLEDVEEELGIDLMTFISNYRQLLSLKGRNLKISIEEVQKQLEQFDKNK